MITWENYEEYMMMHADGELSPAEALALMTFVAQYPELRKELEAYTWTKVMADTTQVFANKEALLKSLSAKRIVVLPVWGKYSIAAAVVAIIFVTLFKYNATEDRSAEIAKTISTSVPAVTHKPEHVAAADNKIQSIATASVAVQKVEVKVDAPTALHKTTVKRVYANRDNKGVAKERTTNKNEEQHTNTATPIAVAVNEKTKLSKLPVGTTRMIGSDGRDIVSAEIKELPAYAVHYTGEEDEEKRSFWDRLPIDDMKKAKMEHMANAVADAYKDVNTAKEELYARSISIKVEKRKLMISF